MLMELRKQSAWSDTRAQFYCWRTASGQEVDIVQEDSSRRDERAATGRPRWLAVEHHHPQTSFSHLPRKSPDRKRPEVNI